MDRRRAAGALLALAVCIASSDGAPTASNQTALDLYEGAAEGCYYNFQHYGEGDRIMTNEPCLNCTCHNRMLMCYLRVCPFTKPIGQDCTVEKRADQCCPIVTCPDVPVDLLTSTSTTSPAEYGGTGVGKLDKYGCSINGKYFPEGSKVPPTPNKPCEHCYCIRNMTTCVMQECTLHVDGCTPIYHKDVCCPVRYSCDHPEDEMLLLDDMTTTVRPTPGFLLTTTTLSPVTQMSQDCVHEDRIVPDGALIKTEKACEHCYCMKGDIVCVVQECGTPMENEGKNCTSQPPREGQCCPDTYICEGDEIGTELPSEYTTAPYELEEITTLSPPRRVGVEGSGYRKETEESYTEMPLFETETEGSGYDHDIQPSIDSSSEKQTPDVITETTDDILYITSSTAKTPTLEEIEKSTEPDKELNTVPSGIFEEETSETPQQTTVSETVKVTKPSKINEKDTSKDKTVAPELFTSQDITDKQEVMTATTESVFRKEDEINEVTDHYEHTEPEKVSTPHVQIVEHTTSLFEYATSKTEVPTDEKLTTETPIIKPIEEKETTTHSFIEIDTSASTIMPSSEGQGVYETTTYTQGLLEDSSSEEPTHDSGDTTKQKEATTELLMESSTLLNRADDEDTKKESDETTESHVDVSTPAVAIKPSDVIDEVTEKVNSTESSDDTDKSEKESTTAKPTEITETKETSTESLLETSTYTATSKHSDEVSSESTVKDIEVTTEYSLETATSPKEPKPSDTIITTVTDASDQITSTTDKTSILETTNIDNQENEVEGFARIPGEGDCLINSITYRNNSEVPSSNNCHTGCKCVSSIVKCDPIICSPPPEYMDNCQPTYDSPDSCCPTYICHTVETMPPQPDSHMSGTDKPVPSDVDCHGEECIIKQGEETPTSSEKPAVSDCGVAGCDGVKTTPECHGEQCIIKQTEESPAPGDKPVKQGEESLVTSDKPVKHGEESPVTSDKPVKEDEESPITSDKPVKQGEESPVTSDKPIKQGEESSVTPDKTVKEDETSPVTSDKPVKQGEESPVTSDKPVKEDEEPHVTSDYPVKQGEEFSATTDKPVKEDEASPVTSDKPVKEDEKSPVTSDKPVKQGEESPVTSDKPVQENEESPMTSDKPAFSECGPAGCGDDIQTTPECHDEQCIVKQGEESPVTSEKPVVSDCGPAGCDGEILTTPECHGEQCVIKQGADSPVASDKPVVSECGPSGCGGGIQTTPECHGEDCLIKQGEKSPVTGEKPAVSDCGPAGCDVDVQTTPECHGEQCIIKHGEEPSATSEKPVASDCGSAGCDDDVKTTPECHGDECIIKQGEESPVTSEKPTDTVCGPAGCDSEILTKPECDGKECMTKQGEEYPVSSEKPVVSDCGSDGCDGDLISSTEKDSTESQCDGKECLQPVCSGKNCQPALPTKPCDDENCDIEPVIIPDKDKPLCQNKDDCQPQIPCEGDACKPIDCNTADCAPAAVPISPSIEKDQMPEICSDENNCQKQEDEPKSPCNDDSCRRKDSGGELETLLPIDCTTAECKEQKPDTSGEILETETKTSIAPQSPELISTPEVMLQQTEKSPTDIQTETSTENKLPETKTEIMEIEQETSSKAPQEKITDATKAHEETSSKSPQETMTVTADLKEVTASKSPQETESSPYDVLIETSTKQELSETMTETMLLQEESSSQSPQKEEGSLIDIPTKLPSEHIPSESTTEPLIIDESTSKSPHTEKSPIEKEKEIPSSESLSTITPSSEHSSQPPDFTLKISEFTTEFDEMVTHTEPATHFEHVTTVPHVTESEHQQEKEEIDIAKLTTVSNEEQYTTKPFEEQVTEREKPETITTQLPQAFETPTESQQASITESKEGTTDSSLDVATETYEETAITEGLKITDIPHSMTMATVDKESSESPEYVTPKLQEGITTTSPTLEQEVSEGPKISDTEKESLAPEQHMTQQPVEGTTEKHVSATDTSSTPLHEIDLHQETVTVTYLPTIELSSPINQEEIDETTSISPQEAHSQTIKTVEVTEKSTSIQEEKLTESHIDVVTTEATKQEDNESVTESAKDEEVQTKAPVTNVPLLPEDITATTAEEFVTLQPEITIPDKQKEIESSETPVTISYEVSTTSKDVMSHELDDTKKMDSHATDKSTEETDLYTTKKDSMVPIEPSFTEQDKQTESPTSLASEPHKESSSTSTATLSDSERETSTPPDIVTYGPTEILVTTEAEELITTEKVLVSEVTDKSSSSDDGVGIKQPISDITERTEPEKEVSTTEVVKVSTEPQPTVIAEDDFRTSEPQHNTEKVIEAEESVSTKKPMETVFNESLATTEQTGQSFKPIDSETTTASPLIEDVVTEISQATLTDYEKETEKTPEHKDEKEEEPTESPIQTYTESEDFETKTTSFDIITPIQEDSDKETISPVIHVEYPVTESEKPPSTDEDVLYPPTEMPDNVVTKEDIGTKTPEKLFTTAEDATAKIHTEEPETYTEISVSVTKQEKESETPSISDLGPKIKDKEDSTQSDIIPLEISTKSPAIPESHVKEEDQDLHMDVTSPTYIQTSPLQEGTHSTISELQTEELLEVTKKPQKPATVEPHVEITELTSESVTEAVQKEIITENPLDHTSPDISEITIVPHQEKTTSQSDDILTKLPGEIDSQEPQVPVTDKYPKDTPVESQTETSTDSKDISTEKTQKPLDTVTMNYEEKTTLQPYEVVTEVLQDVVTEITHETSKVGVTETPSSIELTTKSDTESQDVLTKGPEITGTSTSHEQTTEDVHETIPEEQETISTKLPEIKDTKYDELTDKPKLSTSVYEFTTKAAIIDEVSTKITEISPGLPDEEILKTEAEDTTTTKYDVSETTPYVVELEEHTHKTIEETSATLPEDLENEIKPTESHVELSTEKEIVTEVQDSSDEKKDQYSTSLPSDDITKQSEQELEKSTPSLLPTEDLMSHTTTPSPDTPAHKHDDIPSTQPQENVPSTPELDTPLQEIEIPVQTEKAPALDVSIPEEEVLPVTGKATTLKVEEDITTRSPVSKPEEKPSETLPPSAVPETPKPGFNEILPTDEIPEDEGHFPPSGGYGQEPDYVEEDQAFGPGTCRYGGKVYVSAQQIPRDDPCDFCFCFRSDIICLQQSCPPPIHGCHEEPIQGFCCPRYECPVAMATSLNVTTTTTTTTTTLPPHFLPHAYKGAAQRRGCQIKGHTYKVGEVVRASSGPCLHCTCGGDGQMKCDPKACTPEPMLRQMIAAAVSAKRRR